MSVLLTLLAGIAVIWALAYHRVSAMMWTLSAAIGLGILSVYSGWPQPVLALLWLAFVTVALLGNPTPIRRTIIGRPLLHLFRKVLPQVSQTEQEALDAGTVWWDGDLFSGNPDWYKLLSFRKPVLSPEEQAFVDGPVEELCEMLSDWEITHELHDLPPRAWQFIKDKGFLGMIIPKEYGGLGFSALAHSEVIMKLTTRSGTAAVSVMVPNSLGPGDLLLRHGTREQKDHYLPRLARGIEIPCFALTSPEAGSDAGAIPDFGIVCRAPWRGEADVLGIRLTWEKRYITLGPIATLLGLAFQLYDVDRLLGDTADLGITLALIPTDTPGVHIGRRHLPLNAAFMNGPNWGKDVFIPMEYVIGGMSNVGRGWQMLMNSLAAGRSISLPANSVGIAKMCALTTGAYGRVRTQFKVPIGHFEGVEEAMARIAGNTYLMDAARAMTAGAVDAGEKPSVISAIVKYHLTERGRQVVNDAMDVHGGKGICMGPHNYLARVYQQIPIAITVEGANILTRSMIIFGQGVVRDHPYILREMAAARDGDQDQALRDFDEAFFGHLGFVAANKARAFWLGLTSARFTKAPASGATRRYFQHLTRLSSAFAFVADAAVVFMGGALKRRERLSARLGDILSLLYLASATLKRFEDDGRPAGDLPLLQWSMQDTLHKMEEAFYGLLDNFPSRMMAWSLRRILFPYGRTYRPPGDELGGRVAGLMLFPNPGRERLTKGVFISKNENDPVRVLESALCAAIAAEEVEAKIRAAQQAGMLAEESTSDVADEARRAGIITTAEAQLLERARRLHRRVIMVDDFPKDLGKTEIHQTTEPVTFEALRKQART